MLPKGDSQKKKKELNKINRVGIEKYNNQGYLMKVIEYNGWDNVVVEFQDEHKCKVNCQWDNFKAGRVGNPFKRIGEERINNEGCPMKIVEYKNSVNLIIEFQDEYKARVNATYQNFLYGKIKNPYHASISGIGIVGNKYDIEVDGKIKKEYETWRQMIKRCFDEKEKIRLPWYKDVTCCDEWLFYENFYEWLHDQENFDKWLNGDRWAIDKDILVKGNKVYSPDTCCLVPNNINQLFVKSNAIRGKYPIGVYRAKDGMFEASCNVDGHHKYLGRYPTFEKAFNKYKRFKEDVIKNTAKNEYDKGNIIQQCYDAMIDYEVEITD